MKSKKINILIGATGSVASIKIPELVDLFKQNPDYDVRVVPTKAAHFFFTQEQVNAEIYTDEQEWALWKKKTDPVLHIDLRNWADIMIIAPLDANTLAKIANGLCDNLLTCVLRAWDPRKPIIACPAMNTNMWMHPFTSRHISVLREMLNFQIIDPISKTLACGDTGIGAMEEPGMIVSKMTNIINEQVNKKVELDEGDLI
ncbi:flavoprotein [Phascolomyces articulosus]|uniref:Flavoprotein n=1 Tax=Phascolomyces articulosus TaxID=60185 RepID=A0AAD5K9D0_9FUNG|nr:flavoprotein [Phascolomyces articulosus]